MSASRSASTKPPLPLGKTRAETTIAKKKPASSLSTAKHKRIIHRSSSFSEQDESFSRVGSRSKSSDLKLCKDIDNSAVISKMEREINELRKENNSLKKELTEVRTLYDQLINEQPSECFNERRVLMLKSQIIQLERQLLLFTNSLESHFARLLDASNKIGDLIEELEKKLISDKLVLNEEDFESILNQLGAIKKTINRPVQLLPDKIAQPLLFLNSFINPSVNDDCTCTLLDICCGRMDTINLKQVARLESKLARLYQSLIGLQSSLGVNLIVSENKKHLQERLDLAKSNLQQCCHDLLQLSLLVPSAPWPAFKKSWDEFGFTADSVISKLPPFARDRKEGRDVIHGVVKAFTYAHHMLQSKCNALTKELSFYESVCKLQTDYIESFYNSVIIAYKKFDEDVQHCLSQPIKALLEAYDGLSQLPSDSALKHFLSVLHDNYDKLRVIINQLDGNTSQGVEALLEFKKCFFNSLAVLQQQQEHKAET